MQNSNITEGVLLGNYTTQRKKEEERLASLVATSVIEQGRYPLFNTETQRTQRREKIYLFPLCLCVKKKGQVLIVGHAGEFR
jgi:hypothetical protein